MTLNPVELRVLGALIEKEIATPEAYPLSLNALLNACNQKSSRDPVLELREDEVRQALHGLEELNLVSVARDARVAKFEHRARTVLNLRRDETAILCLLLLRGPQTPGELRSRADRLYTFDDLPAVEGTLNRLATAPGAAEPQQPPASGAMRPLVAVLPRQPGAREARWMHLLGGPPASQASASWFSASTSLDVSSPNPELSARVSTLEAEVAELRAAVSALQAALVHVGSS